MSTEDLPPLPDEDVVELPPLDSSEVALPPLSDCEDEVKIPPLPDFDEMDTESIQFPSLPASQEDVELPPLPDMAIPVHPAGYAPQPPLQQRKKGLVCMIVFAAAAVYSTADAWLAAQAVEQSERESQGNLEKIRLTEKKTEEDNARIERLISSSMVKEQLQGLEEKIASIKREKERYAHEISQLNEKKNDLRRQIEKLEDKI